LNIEIIRNTLYKSCLVTFYDFCKSEIGGRTGEVMCERLALVRSKPKKFHHHYKLVQYRTLERRWSKASPEMCLFPFGLTALARAAEYEQMHCATDSICAYRFLFVSTVLSDGININGDMSFGDKSFQHEVQFNVNAFMEQFHFGVFYSYLELQGQGME